MLQCSSQEWKKNSACRHTKPPLRVNQIKLLNPCENRNTHECGFNLVCTNKKKNTPLFHCFVVVIAD